MNKLSLILTVFIIASMSVLATTYEECIFAAETNSDLSSVDLSNSEKTIHVKCNTQDIELDTGDIIDELWVLGNGKVYFSADSEIIYLDKVDSEGLLTIGELGAYTIELKLTGGFMELFLLNNYIDEEMILSFSIKDGNIFSLGTQKKSSESYEVTWWSTEFEDYEEVGAQEQDAVLTSGTKIKKPKENGINDQVVLELPSEIKKDYTKKSDDEETTPEDTITPEEEEEPEDTAGYQDEYPSEQYYDEEKEQEIPSVFACDYPECKHPSKNQCLAEGKRVGVMYCEEGEWNLAKQDNEKCLDNYQCLNKICENGNCQAINIPPPVEKKSFFRKIMCWFISTC